MRACGTTREKVHMTPGNRTVWRGLYVKEDAVCLIAGLDQPQNLRMEEPHPLGVADRKASSQGPDPAAWEDRG